jgi:sterol desaturase/sphingolipid hydroxylase (fatty acid hydroxylase superfamily)
MKKLVSVLMLMAVVVVMLAGNAFALSADAQAVLAAVDVAGLSTAITAVLVAFIGVALVFLAYRYGRRAISRG